VWTLRSSCDPAPSKEISDSTGGRILVESTRTWPTGYGCHRILLRWNGSIQNGDRHRREPGDRIDFMRRRIPVALAGPTLERPAERVRLLDVGLKNKPDAVALVSPERTWSWRELDEASTRLAG
jgi:hypothetical protein